jgi:hypothetical protein
MADSRKGDIRQIGQRFLAKRQARAWPSEAELASARALLRKEIRAMRASELRNAREAPLPPEFESVSEAYLRALSDDLDDT